MVIMQIDTVAGFYSRETDVTDTQQYTALWSSVLSRALLDVEKPPKDTLSVVDRSWFESDEVAIGSFVFICEVLDLDPDTLRNKVYKLYEKEAAEKTINRTTIKEIKTSGRIVLEGRMFVTLGHGAKTLGITQSAIEVRVITNEITTISVKGITMFNFNELSNIVRRTACEE